MQRIHQVVVVRSLGATVGGRYSRGNYALGLNELDVIDGYFPTIIEELEAESIRYEVMETRDRPGTPAESRQKHVPPFSLVLHLRAGWFPTTKAIPKTNLTTISYGGQRSRILAEEMADAVGQWGTCWAFGHRIGNPRVVDNDPLLLVEETKAVAIEPFALNGADAPEYLKRLPQLGSVIGRAVADHLKTREQAITHEVVSLLRG